MNWDPKTRPPTNVCPKIYCFHWAPPGTLANMSGKAYSSVPQAVSDRSAWRKFPDGGCTCTIGKCLRLHEDGDGDLYETNPPSLADAGLPWFYFCTLDSLGTLNHERFVSESQAWWGRDDDD